MHAKLKITLEFRGASRVIEHSRIRLLHEGIRGDGYVEVA